jgi:WD40 repeat protein
MSAVKILNIGNVLFHEFNSHKRAITDIQPHSQSSLVMTTSLDMTLRVWNMRTLQETYKLDLGIAPLGVQLMDHSHVYLWSRESVAISALNQVSKYYASYKYYNLFHSGIKVQFTDQRIVSGQERSVWNRRPHSRGDRRRRITIARAVKCQDAHHCLTSIGSRQV